VFALAVRHFVVEVDDWNGLGFLTLSTTSSFLIIKFHSESFGFVECLALSWANKPFDVCCGFVLDHTSLLGGSWSQKDDLKRRWKNIDSTCFHNSTTPLDLKDTFFVFVSIKLFLFSCHIANGDILPLPLCTLMRCASLPFMHKWHLYPIVMGCQTSLYKHLAIQLLILPHHHNHHWWKKWFCIFWRFSW